MIGQREKYYHNPFWSVHHSKDWKESCHPWLCVCVCVCSALCAIPWGSVMLGFWLWQGSLGGTHWHTLSEWRKDGVCVRGKPAGLFFFFSPLTSFFPNVVFLLCHITHSLCWTAHCFQISEHEIHTHMHTCTHAQNPFHNLVCFECWLYPIWLNESQYSLAWAQYVGMVTGKSWLPYKLSTAIGWVSGRICCLWI